jgi:undecaprenyl-diphosphatase
LIFEHQFRVLFAVPIYASIFITLNGLILIAAEKRAAKNKTELGIGTEDEIIPLRIKPLNAVVIGLGESLALFAGISRSGITTSIGLARNLSHHVAADFAFLAAFPVISIAAVYKLPEALSSENHLIFGQMVVGSVVAFISTYFSVTFLIRWFKSRTLYPFAIYCIIFGIASIIKFS